MSQARKASCRACSSYCTSRSSGLREGGKFWPHKRIKLHQRPRRCWLGIPLARQESRCVENGRRVMQSRYELRERVFGAENVAGAVTILADLLSQIGFNSFATGYVAGAVHDPSGQWRKFQHQAINFPKGWDDVWHRFNHHCPYYHACFDGRVGFDWATVRTRDSLTDNERKAWRYLADFGLMQGFTLPIHAPRHFSFVTVVGEAHDLSWARRAEANVASLMFTSHVYYEAVRERFPEFSQPCEDALLTDRERECLGWVAAGKTNDEVATILGLSIETVKIYLKRAMRKLDATTRAQAVAKAYRVGLIE